MHKAEQDDVGWMDITMTTIVKVSKCKSTPFLHAESMSKWLKGSVYIGSIIYKLIYLSDSFPGGLKIDLERSSTFPTLMLSMYIDS